MVQAAVAHAPAAIRWISSAPHAVLPSAEEHLSCAQGKPIFRREQQGGDAQGRTADVGPGGEPGGNEGTDERGGGGWDSGEGSGRSDGVVVERGSRQIPAQKVDQWQRSPLQAGIRLARQGRLLRLVSSYLPAQPHASTLHDGVRVRLGCFTNLHRLSARGPVPKVMLKLELQRWPRTSDACGPAP